MVINSQGLGHTLDLSLFDRVAGIDSTPATVEWLDGRGSVYHAAFGFLAGLMPGSWPVLVTSAFGAYQLSKVEGGKPFSRIAGGLLEFSAGLGLAGLLLMARGGGKR